MAEMERVGQRFIGFGFSVRNSGVLAQSASPELPLHPVVSVRRAFPKEGKTIPASPLLGPARHGLL